MQPSFFRGGRGLPGVEITSLMGKQPILGKIRGKLRSVIIVTTRGDVVGGLVPP